MKERGIAPIVIIVVIAIVAAVAVGGYYLVAGGSEESVTSPKEIYTLPVSDENLSPTLAWQNAENLEEIEFVAEKDSYSVLVFTHQYSIAGGASLPEWIVIAYSAPETSSEIRVAVVRLGYQTLHPKKAYKSSYPVSQELTSDEAVAIASDRASEAEWQPVEENIFGVEVLGGNYICHYDLGDFRGTVIVNKHVGEPIFYATTVWQGSGSLIIPSTQGE